MSFDPVVATAAYIDSLGAAALQKASDYTIGNHWLILWGLLVSFAVTFLIMRWGVLARMQASFGVRRPNLAAFFVSASALLISTLIALPWTWWSDYRRELEYGRTSQPLGDWLGQFALSNALSIILGGLMFMALYALMRRAGKRWWLWSGGFVAAVITLLMLGGPVLIEPLFNDYKPLPAGPVRDALEVQAEHAGVPKDRIFVFDGSRQSNNFTANVSGLFGTARIAISDVALKGASLDEVKAVTGHEIGHYVLGHIWSSVLLLALLSMLGFFLMDRLFPLLSAFFGNRARICEPQTLPILLFGLSLFGILAMPILNWESRTDEAAADRYSLETVKLPDALATALVKTAEYRYPRPGAVQEFLFYSHPSVERRVRAAMEWKAEHLPEQGDNAGH